MTTLIDSKKELALQHIDDLRRSGLKDETIQKYGFASVNKEEASSLLGYNAPSGGWLLRYPGSEFLKIKPDKPYTPDRKYESPKGMTQDFFITCLAADIHNEQEQPYYFVEGEKKAIALEQERYAAISVPGVWGWKSHGHTKEELGQLNISGRECYIIFDSDKLYNKHVLKAENEFAGVLASLGAKVKIVNLDPTFGKGADDALKRLGQSDFRHYIDKAQDYTSDLKREIPQLPPVSLPQFLLKDIPPTEYYVTGLLIQGGKTMISGQAKRGKSILAQNLAMAMASGRTKFLEKFDVKPARVLYLDLEMGESTLLTRFRLLCKDEPADIPDLFIKYIPDANFLDKGFQATLETWLSTLNINVLVIDPIGNAWDGDENDKQQVQELTTYLNTLIAKFHISILALHHWRKSTQHFKGGGEMAAGSYKWAAWLDHHITLSGNPESITINCEDSRHDMRFKPFMAKLNPETLNFEYITDFEKKYTEATLAELFNDLGGNRILITDLIAHAKAKFKKNCERTIRNLIKTSANFGVDKSSKEHYLVRKLENEDFFDGKEDM